jgi:hypothetical protein
MTRRLGRATGKKDSLPPYGNTRTPLRKGSHRRGFKGDQGSAVAAFSQASGAPGASGRVREFCLYDSAHEHNFAAGMNRSENVIRWESQQNESGDFKHFSRNRPIPRPCPDSARTNHRHNVFIEVLHITLTANLLPDTPCESNSQFTPFLRANPRIGP